MSGAEKAGCRVPQRRQRDLLKTENPIVIAREVTNANGEIGMRHYYWCPGCKTLHGIAINPHKQDNGAGWTFAGTLECPSYEPSQKSDFGDKRVCHTFIRNGQIQFLDDCTHELKGQTVPMVPVPDWALVDQRRGD